MKRKRKRNLETDRKEKEENNYEWTHSVRGLGAVDSAWISPNCDRRRLFAEEVLNCNSLLRRFLTVTPTWRYQNKILFWEREEDKLLQDEDAAGRVGRWLTSLENGNGSNVVRSAKV